MKTILIILMIMSATMSQDHEDNELYTCGMHPNVIQKGPGKCPICKMDLLPVKTNQENKKKENKILYWRAPMNPNEIYDKPGKSAMGMDLIPVMQSDVEGVSVVISPALQQNIGLKTAPVMSMDFSKTIKAVGNSKYDESKISMVSNKFSGWVEGLNANRIGQKIRKGDLLFNIYSPEIIAIQEEFISALSMAKVLGESGNELVNAARKKLEQYDISKGQIDLLEEELKVHRVVGIYSRYSGVITKINIREGGYIQKGKTTHVISNLNQIWVLADFYERDLKYLKKHANVQIKFKGFDDETFEGTIDYVYPEIDLKNRTAKARIVLKNKDHRIKVNLFASLSMGTERRPKTIVIPEESVIRTGERSIVIIKEGNSFTPRNITLGDLANNRFEVKSGLKIGETVVTSAQFMIDSESKLKEAINKVIEKAKSSTQNHSEQP